MGRRKIEKPLDPKDAIESKEDLIKYIENVEGTVFLEELWERCVELAKENEGK